MHDSRLLSAFSVSVIFIEHPEAPLEHGWEVVEGLGQPESSDADSSTIGEAELDSNGVERVYKSGENPNRYEKSESICSAIRIERAHASTAVFDRGAFRECPAE